MKSLKTRIARVASLAVVFGSLLASGPLAARAEGGFPGGASLPPPPPKDYCVSVLSSFPGFPIFNSAPQMFTREPQMDSTGVQSFGNGYLFDEGFMVFSDMLIWDLASDSFFYY